MMNGNFSGFNCDGTNINIMIIGYKNGKITNQCKVKKKPEIKENKKVVWNTEDELGSCNKEIFKIKNALVLNVRVQTDDRFDVYCPKFVEFRIEDKCYRAKMGQYFYQRHNNGQDHIVLETDCS